MPERGSASAGRQAKYKRDIEDEKIRLTDFDSEKSLIELYFDQQREVAPIYYDTALKVLAGLQTEAGCERIFRSMTAQVRDEASTISPWHLSVITLCKTNMKWCKPTVDAIWKKYMSLPPDWDQRRY